jgi:predicted metal-dependent hydrolase
MTTQRYLEIDGTQIRVDVIRERRRGARYSVIKDGVNMRIPFILTRAEEDEQFELLKKWLLKVKAKRTTFLERFEAKNYKTGDILTVGSRQYLLDIYIEDRKSHAAKLQNKTITFRLGKDSSEESRQKAITELISKVVSNDFLPEISRRIHEWNKIFFGKKINSIRMKHNHSNWGSCSRDGNITLSSRLLFAPDDVIDYVIVHELSHLIEMNHSDRFWKVVSDVMPNYEEKEKWLSKNGNLCNF